jgi:hypothetical protein
LRRGHDPTVAVAGELQLGHWFDAFDEPTQCGLIIVGRVGTVGAQAGEEPRGQSPELNSELVQVAPAQSRIPRIRCPLQGVLECLHPEDGRQWTVGSRIGLDDEGRQLVTDPRPLLGAGATRVEHLAGGTEAEAVRSLGQHGGVSDGLLRCSDPGQQREDLPVGRPDGAAQRLGVDGFAFRAVEVGESTTDPGSISDRERGGVEVQAYTEPVRERPQCPRWEPVTHVE